MTAYGLQLYSIRDLAEKDLAEAIRTAARIGYKGMEFAGFYEVTIEKTSLSAYHDGDIFYQIHEINIPITEEIIKEGRFYIQTNEMPPIRTSNEGYSISVEVSD